MLEGSLQHVCEFVILRVLQRLSAWPFGENSAKRVSRSKFRKPQSNSAAQRGTAGYTLTRKNVFRIFLIVWAFVRSRTAVNLSFLTSTTSSSCSTWHLIRMRFPWGTIHT